MKTYAKFTVLVVVIIGTLVWLAVGGIGEAKTYYKTVAELHQMGDEALDQRLRVGGDVEEGSIVRDGNAVRVVYEGIDPLPDTVRDGAQALADGKMGGEGVFHASRIQAKCASKYEAKPETMPIRRNQAEL